MTESEFYGIQSRVQATQEGDAWPLLCEFRRLRRRLDNISEKANLSEGIWGVRERLGHAQERLDEIHKMCMDALRFSDPPRGGGKPTEDELVSSPEGLCQHNLHPKRCLVCVFEAFEKLMGVIESVHAAVGDDVCWMDIDRIFAAAGLPVPDRKVGDKAAMLKNCAKFIDTMCAGGKWESYEKVLKERDSLREELDFFLRHDAERWDKCARVHARLTQRGEPFNQGEWFPSLEDRVISLLDERDKLRADVAYLKGHADKLMEAAGVNPTLFSVSAAEKVIASKREAGEKAIGEYSLLLASVSKWAEIQKGCGGRSCNKGGGLCGECLVKSYHASRALRGSVETVPPELWENDRGPQ